MYVNEPTVRIIFFNIKDKYFLSNTSTKVSRPLLFNQHADNFEITDDDSISLHSDHKATSFDLKLHQRPKQSTKQIESKIYQLVHLSMKSKNDYN
jgi:hypothetical protein